MANQESNNDENSHYRYAAVLKIQPYKIKPTYPEAVE